MSYQDRDTLGMYSSNEGDGPGPRLMGADTLLGNDVYNHKNEKLGDVKEFMLSMDTGKVSYVVLSYGGFLTLGEKLFAVPWKALTLDTVNHRFVMNVEKEKFENAPGFNVDDWPNMADETWATSIHDYYETEYENRPM